MASLRPLELRYTITNRKAINAMMEGCEAMMRAGDDLPWNEDIKMARRALQCSLG